MGSIPSDRYVASVHYLQDLMTFLQRPDTSPGSPLCFAPPQWYAPAHRCIQRILLDISYGYFRISKLDMQMEMLPGYKVRIKRIFQDTSTG
jgi:hypothetical protein